MEAIKNIPNYSGIGIYAIIDTVTDKRYIGSSRNIRRRLMQHNISIKNGKGNQGLCTAYNQGHILRCEIIEKINYGINEFYLADRELFYICEFDSINNGFNTHKTPSSSKDELESQLAETVNPKMRDYIISLIESKNEPLTETDRINIAVPKGKKDEIKAAADQEGKSVNAFINEAIDEKMSGAGVQSIAQPAPPSDHDRQQEQDGSETD